MDSEKQLSHFNAKEQALKDVCAVSLSTGKNLNEVAAIYGISRKQLAVWWDSDTTFRQQVEQYRSQFVSSSSMQVYTKLVVDAPKNIDVIMAVRDDEDSSPTVKLKAAGMLLNAVMEHAPKEKVSGAPGVELPTGTLKTFVEALSNFTGKQEESIVAEYSLIVDTEEEDEVDDGILPDPE